MKLPKTSATWIAFILAVSLLLVLVSVAPANRSFDVGTDSLNYSEYFYNTLSKNATKEREPGFAALTNLATRIDDSHNTYFALVFLIFNFSLLYCITQISAVTSICAKNKTIFLIASFALLFLSSWYLVATTNALRQGLSLPFVYIAIFYLHQRRFVLFTVALAIAISFHYSSALIIPFLPLLFLKSNRFTLIAVIIAIGYPLGINEVVVEVLSEIVGFDLHELVSEHGGSDARYFGFQWDYYAYSIFWAILPGVAAFILVKESRDGAFLLAKVYTLLLFPFFTLGFGAYSNRYAFMAWLFVPLIQSYLLSNLSVSSTSKTLASLVVLALGLSIYISNFL